jgi:hypothetical protein
MAVRPVEVRKEFLRAEPAALCPACRAHSLLRVATFAEEPCVCSVPEPCLWRLLLLPHSFFQCCVPLPRLSLHSHAPDGTCSTSHPHAHASPLHVFPRGCGCAPVVRAQVLPARLHGSCSPAHLRRR